MVVPAEEREGREERIERAWREARGWFESRSGDPEATVHVRLGAVDLGRVQGCFEAVERRAREAFTSGVWARPEDFDPEVAGARRGVEALAAGRLAALSIHYELTLGRLSCAFLLTVLRARDGALEGRGFTRLGFLRPEAPARERFEALARHALELAELLGAASVRIGPDPRARAPGEGERWTAV